jgi:hypothetical protein
MKPSYLNKREVPNDVKEKIKNEQGEQELKAFYN